VSGLVEVARFDSPIKAELARMFVESYGLNAIIFDGNLYNNSEGALIGVRLMVPEDELDEALEALREYQP
jgi:hypothetical protein